MLLLKKRNSTPSFPTFSRSCASTPWHMLNSLATPWHRPDAGAIMVIIHPSATLLSYVVTCMTIAAMNRKDCHRRVRVSEESKHMC